MTRGATAVLVLLTAMAPLAQGRFEVASVRLNTSGDRLSRLDAPVGSGRLTITNMRLRDVILTAYGVQAFQLVNAPEWVLTQRVDISAAAAGPATARQLHQMLQPLLRERFGLVVRPDTRQMDALALRAVRTGVLGPKLVTSTADCVDAGVGNTAAFVAARAANPAICGPMAAPGPGRIVARGVDMRTLAALIGQDPPIVDRTDLAGRFDVDLTYTPEIFTADAVRRRGGAAPSGVDPDGPPLVTALREQLGLKLEATRAAIDVLVVERIEPLRPD